MAAGSKPLVPPIPGIDNKKVIEVYDVHKQNALPAGENVVICVGGLSAIDTALEHAPEEAAASSPSLRCVIVYGSTPTTTIMILTVVFGALAYPLSASIPSIVGQSVFGPKEFSAISATLMTGVYLGQALYAPVMSIFLSSSAGFEGGWKFLCGTGIATMILLLLSITTSPMKKARV